MPTWWSCRFFAAERPLRGAAGRLDWRLCGQLSALLAAGRLTGAAGEAALLLDLRGLRSPPLLVLGAGERARSTPRQFDGVARDAVARGRAIGAGALALPCPTTPWGSMAHERRAAALLAGAAAAVADAAPPVELRLRLLVPREEVVHSADVLRRARAPRLPESVLAALRTDREAGGGFSLQIRGPCPEKPAACQVTVLAADAALDGELRAPCRPPAPATGSAMSLVGSLEDLGLGDILQIVSLSRKSGLLLLRSEEGDGRIVFSDGLVRAAYVKGEPEDLRGLLVPGGFADAGELDLAIETAEQSGLPLDEVIAQRTGLTAERLDSLRREHVERAVLRMFTWRVGEFSFDVRDGIAQRDAELALPTGINSQYLMMEATRLGDESGDGRDSGEDGAGDSAAEEDRADDGFVLSGESGVEETPVALPGGIPEPAEADPGDPREVLALSAAARAEEEPETQASEDATPEAVAPEAASDEQEAGSAPEPRRSRPRRAPRRRSRRPGPCRSW